MPDQVDKLFHEASGDGTNTAAALKALRARADDAINTAAAMKADERAAFESAKKKLREEFEAYRREFVTKDSGKREDFETGARRDVQDDKPGYEQIPVWALERLAMVYTRGAKKYGRDNWKKGIPFTRMLASALRHIFQFCQGEGDEDHLAQAAWNLFGIMYYEWAIQHGKLNGNLDDRDLPHTVLPCQQQEAQSK